MKKLLISLIILICSANYIKSGDFTLKNETPDLQIFAPIGIIEKDQIVFLEPGKSVKISAKRGLRQIDPKNVSFIKEDDEKEAKEAKPTTFKNLDEFKGYLNSLWASARINTIKDPFVVYTPKWD